VQKVANPITDLTLLYITANQLPEAWMQYQIEVLQDEVPEVPIMSVSRKFLNLGRNFRQDGPISYWTIYMSMLEAAKHATTEYVAMVEDDVLYSRQHFAEYRPPKDTVAYDMSRWSLYVWHPMYHWKSRVSNGAMIASRELVIQALEERKAKWPDGAPNAITGEIGRRRVEHALSVTHRKSVEWFCTMPIVHLHHVSGVDNGDHGYHPDGRKMEKRIGRLKAFDIPKWGKATEVIAIYEQGRNRQADPGEVASSAEAEPAVVSPQRLAG
jgi:hypothetical protein